MAFFRKAGKSGSMLGRTVNAHITLDISSIKPSILQTIRCMSNSKLFIGGLSYSTDDASLGEAFDKYGEVAETRVVVDRETGRSRGFGFVTYSSVMEASAAIQALDQQELHGRRIRVNYANDRTRGYGGGGFRGGNFGGGSYNSGGFGGSYGTGGGYNNIDGYGGNYGSGGYGGSSNFDSGVNSYGSGAGADAYPTSGNYSSSNSHGGGDLSNGGDVQNFGVDGSAGGSDNFCSNGGSAGSSAASTGSDGFGDKFGSEESNHAGGADEDLSKDEPLEGNYRDEDDTPDNYADRRG